MSAPPPPTQRILVVDDVPDALEILSATFSAYGMGVETAADGLQALEKVETWRPDAVLLDLSLPGLDGFQVARRLRADPRFSGLPLVAYTAHGSPEHRQQAIEAGCVAVLTKPTPNVVLVATLQQVIAAADEAPPEPALDDGDTATRMFRGREAHRKTLALTTGDLARQWRAMRTSGDVSQGLASLCARIHRFVASCTSHGFEPLCAAAAELERALEDYLRQPAERQRLRVDRYAQRFVEMGARAARLPSPPPTKA